MNLKTLNRLFVMLVLTGANLIAACTGDNAVTPDLSHDVGKAIEGTYTVSLDMDALALDDSAPVTIGHLDLSGDQYTYMPQDVRESAGVSGYFFFIRHPSGRFTVEYYGSVDQNTLLADLPDNEILLFIRFSTGKADVDNEIGLFSVRDRVFLIRVGQKERELYFHAVVNEIQFWRVTKPWAGK